MGGGGCLIEYLRYFYVFVAPIHITNAKSESILMFPARTSGLRHMTAAGPVLLDVRLFQYVGRIPRKFTKLEVTRP